MHFYKDKFRAIRIEKGFTLEKIAEKLDTVKQSVNNWEMGRCSPRPKVVPNIAKALGVSRSAFTDLTDIDMADNSSPNDIKNLIDSFQLLDKEDQIDVLNVVLGKINKRLTKK